jgi:hypothetical protein
VPLTLPRRALLALAATTLVARPARAFDAADRLIVPGERVGAVHASATLDDLALIYRRDIAIGTFRTGGGTLRGARVFRGTAHELEIPADLATRRVFSVTVRGAGGPGRVPGGFETREGIGLGLTPAEIAALNGRPFRIAHRPYGGGWIVLDTFGGALPARLDMTFRPLDWETVAPGEKRALAAREGMMSDSAAATRAAFIVHTISVRFAR